MRSLEALLTFCVLTSTAGCTGAMAISYSPGITKRGVGPIRVDPFRYEPHRNAPEKITANQLQNTAIGNIYITQDVGEFVRDAVKMELQFMGYEHNNSSYRAIRGNVKRFMVDDLGYSVDWTLEAEFEVVTAMGTTFTGGCRATTNTEKSGDCMQGATTEIIRKCIDQFITAAQAQKAL